MSGQVSGDRVPATPQPVVKESSGGRTVAAAILAFMLSLFLWSLAASPGWPLVADLVAQIIASGVAGWVAGWVGRARGGLAVALGLGIPWGLVLSTPGIFRRIPGSVLTVLWYFVVATVAGEVAGRKRVRMLRQRSD